MIHLYADFTDYIGRREYKIEEYPSYPRLQLLAITSCNFYLPQIHHSHYVSYQDFLKNRDFIKFVKNHESSHSYPSQFLIKTRGFYFSQKDTYDFLIHAKKENLQFYRYLQEEEKKMIDRYIEHFVPALSSMYDPMPKIKDLENIGSFGLCQISHDVYVDTKNNIFYIASDWGNQTQNHSLSYSFLQKMKQGHNVLLKRNIHFDDIHFYFSLHPILNSSRLSLMPIFTPPPLL